ncbi:hypothetical protein B0I33_10924 [Prauserella shujinwangii]|uniref:Uncharacterized protein n=1 Tax=Prauserella shujinwangii TaxID=1453103 RepID=A0A2T0LPU0_9PSEU|nr:hypothetical protein [Prauserella shujinwangii]PRX45363.1 hypothetical protein B0I33_10924 [Prauserella shujinwangii]
MAPTVLRSTPHEAELLDRTGIIAASLPRQRRADTAEANLALFSPPESAEQPEDVLPPRRMHRSGIASMAAAVLMFVVAVGGVLGAQRPDSPTLNVAGDLNERESTREPATTTSPAAPKPERRTSEPAPKPPESSPRPAPAPVEEPAESVPEVVAAPAPEPEASAPAGGTGSPAPEEPAARIDLPPSRTSGSVPDIEEEIRRLMEPMYREAEQSARWQQQYTYRWPDLKQYFEQLRGW